VEGFTGVAVGLAVGVMSGVDRVDGEGVAVGPGPRQPLRTATRTRRGRLRRVAAGVVTDPIVDWHSG